MAGRKKKLTQKLADQILELIADGYTIRETFEKVADFTWQSFRTYLINDEELMFRYQKSKELAVDLKLSQLEDKRKELEAKIESGQIDGKAGQNLVNLYKIIVANSQWSASKIASKKYGKAAELTIKGDKGVILVLLIKPALILLVPLLALLLGGCLGCVAGCISVI
jgi:uncharacterized protein YggU (UPF0235/DUF167 family)